MLLLSVLLLQATHQPPPEDFPSAANMVEIVSKPDIWNGKAVWVCGWRKESTSKNFRMKITLFVRARTEWYGLSIDSSLVPIGSDKTSCYFGVIRRYDGLSEQDAIKAGTKHGFADMETHPEYFLAAR